MSGHNASAVPNHSAKTHVNLSVPIAYRGSIEASE